VGEQVNNLFAALNVATENPSDEYTLSVYPNPATSMIHIDMDSPVRDVQVLDLNGEKVLQGSDADLSVSSQAVRSTRFVVQ
jgi:hypothetical protein